MDGKYSSNYKWKNQYFFAMGQWEIFPDEAAEGPRVPREIATSVANASKEPRLLEKELARVNEVLAWAHKSEEKMYYSKIIKATLNRETLAHAVEEIKKRAHSMIASNPSLMASSPPVVNTQGATP
jgi:hypothetical protein